MINLKQFNSKNEEHLKIYLELQKDVDVTNNISSIFNIDYLSYVINSDDINIGMLKIVPERDNFSIDMGILKKYTNLGYGKEALKKAIELLKYIDENYNKLIIRTTYNNEAVINCSKKIGFTYDIEEIERCNSEGIDYLVLSYKNEKNKIKTMI